MNDPAPVPPGIDLSLIEEGLAMSFAERVRWAEEMLDLYYELNPDHPVGFFRSFDSFEEYEAWKLSQDKPWLY